uniref:Butyrophilin subfamily 2 member A2-like n=1 Tax=Xiphophorus maculatus TaxID=8083 RepID=A0A3B5R3C2_XIPMA
MAVLLTYTAEKHCEVHDPDGPPPASVVLILGIFFSVSETFTVSVKSPVSVQRGQTATLPCWLTPSQSAEDMEVRWYQGSDEFDTPVLLYQARAFHYSSQKASYAGRVSFGLKEETSGGLKAGDVSLKLENVTIEDVGKYICYVSSSDDYDSASISLSVTETGRSPLLSAVMKDDNKVNMSCQSDGWHPKPELSWSDSKKALISSNVSFSKNSAGFYSVHSWVLVSSSSEVSCSENSPPLQEGTWFHFWGCTIYHNYIVMCVKYIDTLDFTKNAKAFFFIIILIIIKFPFLTENVQLVDTGNELIKMKNPSDDMKDSLLRDNINAKFPDGDRVTCLTAVRGSPGFSSGRHYWEVSLQSANVDLKTSWWIGVTDKHKIPHDESFPPTTKNGFWFLSSCPKQEDTLHFSTEPETFIYVQSKPKTVGVYLDFDNRNLSFYNVEEKCLIGSLAAKFTGEVFPLFNPGKGDQGTMKILQRPAQDQSNNTEPVAKLQKNSPHYFI